MEEEINENKAMDVLRESLGEEKEKIRLLHFLNLIPSSIPFYPLGQSSKKTILSAKFS